MRNFDPFPEIKHHQSFQLLSEKVDQNMKNNFRRPFVLQRQGYHDLRGDNGNKWPFFVLLDHLE
jgi:hypothetical protein